MSVRSKKKEEIPAALQVRTLHGKVIHPSPNGWLVKTNTKPVNERAYRGNEIDWSKVKCFKDGRYCNVEYFQPVLYDLDDPMPAYNPRWEVYSGTGKKKKLVRIDFSPLYRKWWEKQLERCVNGYEVGGVRLTGPNYFFLNFWRIKGKKIGAGYIAPRFYDLGKMFFDTIEQAQREQKNAMFLKRRQIGYSEMCACLAAWFFTFFPASESLVVAGEGTYADNTFKKVRSGLNEMGRRSDSASADAFYKRLHIDKSDELISGFMDETAVVGFRSRIMSITTKDNIQRASGKAPHFCLMEESGRFRFLKAVYQMILPSVQEGGLQNGRIVVFIGTGGEMDKGVADMMEMFYQPDKNGILSQPNVWDIQVEGVTHQNRCATFVPGWMYYVTDHDGNSYEDIGTTLIKEEMKRLEDNSEALHIYKTQMPLTPQDAFSTSGLSPFDSAKLTAQRTHILSNELNTLAQHGRLDPIIEAGKIVGVKWTGADDVNALDDEGDLLYPVIILEHPERPETAAPLGQKLQAAEVRFVDDYFKNLYFGGTDPYDRDDAAWSDSQGSCSIFKGVREDALSTSTSRLFVARCTYRPSKVEKFYEMTALLCLYYRAQNLIEWSNTGIFKWYTANGYEHLLKERPLLAQAVFKGSKADNKYGCDPQLKPYLINGYKSYIFDYSENMYDLEQVQRALAYRRKNPGGKKFNCDITDSSMLALQHYQDVHDRRFKILAIRGKKKNSRPLFGVIRGDRQQLLKIENGYSPEKYTLRTAA